MQNDFKIHSPDTRLQRKSFKGGVRVKFLSLDPTYLHVVYTYGFRDDLLV